MTDKSAPETQPAQQSCASLGLLSRRHWVEAGRRSGCPTRGGAHATCMAYDRRFMVLILLDDRLLLGLSGETAANGAEAAGRALRDGGGSCFVWGLEEVGEDGRGGGRLGGRADARGRD